MKVLSHCDNGVCIGRVYKMSTNEEARADPEEM